MRHAAAPLLALLVLLPAAGAQWSSDPAANLSIADGASDQTQPKLSSTLDGGVWLSWFDGIASGFDVRVQRLDASGAEALAPSGVLVADRGFSSTQDYGLATSTQGDALVVFRDDSGTGTQISAARIEPDGSLPWGPGNVQLTNTSAFVASPRIASAPGGGAYVAWTQNNTVRVQRLDVDGAAVWASDVVLSPGGAGSYSLADLQPSLDGVIVSLVLESGGFGSPRRLQAQRLDASGAPTWGAAPLAIFTTGSLQFGNFPEFVPDGSGGAVFSWYDTSSFQLQCYVQRVRVDGTAAFAANGVAVSLDAMLVRVSPSATFDPSREELTVAWVEQTSNQSQAGVSAQRFDDDGDRLWGPTGVTLVPVAATSIGNVRAVASGTDTFVVWGDEPSFGQETLHGQTLDRFGMTTATVDVATTPSGKARLVAARTTLGDVALAWTDDRVDSGDVFGQNVRCDGALGPAPAGGAWTDLGSGLAGAAGVPSLTGTGSLCADTDAAVALTGAAPNSLATLVVGFAPLLAPFKGGTLVPTPDILVAGLPTDASGDVTLSFTWVAESPSGLSLYWQAWIPDAGAPVGFAASNALRSDVP